MAGLVLSLVLGVVDFGRADEPDAAEITRRLNAWKDSFTSLRMVYEIRNPGQWRIRKPELAAVENIDDYYRREEWITTDEGKSRTTTWYYEGGQLVRREVTGTDLRVKFRATFDRDAEVPRELHRSWKTPIERRNRSFTPLSELYTGVLSEWMGDVFNRAPPIVQEYGTVDGSRCVAIRRFKDSDDTLWLDLDHDCLPRLHVPEAGIESGSHFHVEEFRPLGDGHWFPGKGTQRDEVEETGYLWIVTEAEVNLDLPDSVFASPRPGPDTELTDYTMRHEPARPGGTSNPGDPLPAARHPAEETLGVSPGTSWTLLAAAALLVLVGIGVSLRSRATRRGTDAAE